jgi:tRNA threonylcarbamoyladenosine biosynthesis protein TsaE
LNNVANLSLEELLLVGQLRAFTIDDMQSWGVAVGKALPAGSVVTLNGDLGTGKTTLARALCAGLGVIELAAVTSPTFAIIQEYATPTATVTHADLYRLNGDAELDALGWDEIVNAAHVLIVEWPDRSTKPWPGGCVQIALAYGASGTDTRAIRVTRV